MRTVLPTGTCLELSAMRWCIHLRAAGVKRFAVVVLVRGLARARRIAEASEVVLPENLPPSRAHGHGLAAGDTGSLPGVLGVVFVREDHRSCSSSRVIARRSRSATRECLDKM